jgi:hypothetical protein
VHVRFTMSMSRLEALHALRIEILGHGAHCAIACRNLSLFWFARCLAEAGAGGADRIRTDDPLLAKQVLSQLSYSPLVTARAEADGASAVEDGGPGRI